MEVTNDEKEVICLIGQGKLVDSIAIILEKADHKIILLSSDQIWPTKIDCEVAIIISEEKLAIKTALITRLEHVVHKDTIIAVNTDSISLDNLQQVAQDCTRVIGLNWTYPADLSYFLEIIVNERTDEDKHAKILSLAKQKWEKDPYTVPTGISVRGRLIASMAREAFYLVENGYANVESVDRSCRNDAGYYMSFAGNFRYMDLMGTGGYGVVMETLNKELATDANVEGALCQLVENGSYGMESDRGFYPYSNGDLKHWEKLQQKFGVEVKSLMEKFPITFDYESNPSEL